MTIISMTQLMNLFIALPSILKVQVSFLIAQILQQASLSSTINEDTRTINLSPTSLVCTPRQPSLSSLLLFPSQPPLRSQLSLLTAVTTTLILAVGSYPSVVQPAVTHATLILILMNHSPGGTIAQSPGYQIKTQQGTR